MQQTLAEHLSDTCQIPINHKLDTHSSHTSPSIVTHFAFHRHTLCVQSSPAKHPSNTRKAFHPHLLYISAVGLIQQFLQDNSPSFAAL